VFWFAGIFNFSELHGSYSKALKLVFVCLVAFYFVMNQQMIPLDLCLSVSVTIIGG
jgi:hypothetical protein